MHDPFHSNYVTHLHSPCNGLKDDFYDGGCLASSWRSMDYSNLRLAQSKQHCHLLAEVKVRIDKSVYILYRIKQKLYITLHEC